jgi:hypothetical protein
MTRSNPHPTVRAVSAYHTAASAKSISGQAEWLHQASTFTQRPKPPAGPRLRVPKDWRAGNPKGRVLAQVQAKF